MSMENIQTPHDGALIAICAPLAVGKSVSALAAELALFGALTVLDGGNRFQPYIIAHLLRQQTFYVNRLLASFYNRTGLRQEMGLLKGGSGRWMNPLAG
jgi:hypothetical protein